MSATPVRMTPPVIGRQQIAQRREQVVVRATAGLEDRKPCGRMRDKYVQQAVAAYLREKALALTGDVAHDLARPGLDLERLGVHAREA